LNVQMNTVENGVDAEQIRQLETRALQLRQEIFSSLLPTTATCSPSSPPQYARLHSGGDGWIELHGDRRSSDDLALVGGVARLLGDQ